MLIQFVARALILFHKSVQCKSVLISFPHIRRKPKIEKCNLGDWYIVLCCNLPWLPASISPPPPLRTRETPVRVVIYVESSDCSLSSSNIHYSLYVSIVAADTSFLMRTIYKADQLRYHKAPIMYVCVQAPAARTCVWCVRMYVCM